MNGHGPRSDAVHSGEGWHAAGEPAVGRSHRSEQPPPPQAAETAVGSPNGAAPGPGGGSEEVVAGAMRGLFGRDVIYVALALLQVIGAAAVTPIVTRSLDTSEFGGVASANAVMQILFILSGAGLPIAIQRYFAARNGPLAAARLLGLSVVIAVLFGVATGVTAPFWAAGLGLGHSGLLVALAAAWGGLGTMTGSSLALLRSQDRIGAYAVVGLFQSVVAEVLSLCLVLAVSATAEAFVWGQVIAQAAACLIGLACAPPRLPRPRDAQLLRGALALGLPMVPAMLGGYVLSAADRLLIGGALGQDAVGRYQIAYNIGSLPTLVLGMLTAVWMPRFFAVEREEDRDAVLAMSRDALYRLLAPVLLGMSVAAPILLRLWAPAEYRTDELLALTAVVVVSAVPYTASLTASRVLLTRSRTRIIATAAVVAAVANIGLNLLVIPIWGLLGAAVVTIAGYALQYVVLIRPSRLPRGRHAGAFPPARLQLLAASVATLLVVELPTDTVWLVIRGALAALCLVWFGLLLKSLSSGSAPASSSGPAEHETSSAS